jgi:hypothetical protein
LSALKKVDTSLMMYAEWENYNDVAIDDSWEENLQTARMAWVRFAENSGHMELQSKP